MGLAITLQALGQDFNSSQGLCGNFNGLRDDDFGFTAPVPEKATNSSENHTRSGCEHNFSNNQAKINHMISTDKIEQLEKFNRQDQLIVNPRQEQFST